MSQYFIPGGVWFNENIDETQFGIPSGVWVCVPFVTNNHLLEHANVVDTFTATVSPAHSGRRQYLLTNGAWLDEGAISSAEFNNPGGMWVQISTTISLSTSIAESTTATDTISNTATLNDSISETATAVDTISTSATLNDSISESTTATDAIDATGSVSAVLSESTTATDVISNTATLHDSLSETTTATDAISAADAISDSISETATATDAIDATVSTPSSTTAIVDGLVQELLLSNDSISLTDAVQELLLSNDSLSLDGAIQELLLSNDALTLDTAVQELLLSNDALTIDDVLMELLLVNFIELSIEETANTDDAYDATGFIPVEWKDILGLQDEFRAALRAARTALTRYPAYDPVPWSMSDWRPWFNLMARAINGIMGGGQNTTLPLLTLNTDTTTTTLVDSRIGATSYINLIPLTDSAAVETWWIDTQANGSAVIHHLSIPFRRQFRVVILS